MKELSKLVMKTLAWLGQVELAKIILRKLFKSKQKAPDSKTIQLIF